VDRSDGADNFPGSGGTHRFPDLRWQDTQGLNRREHFRRRALWPSADFVYIAQVSLYSNILGVAIAQSTYATDEGGEIAALRALLEHVELEGLLVQADALHANRPFCLYLGERGADFLIAVKNSRHKGFQVIKEILTHGLKISHQTSKRERGHGRDITWILRAMPAPPWVMENWPGSAMIIEVSSKGKRQGRRIDETRYTVTSLRTGADALLRHARDRWSNRFAEAKSYENSWHWPRDTKLNEDAHRYRERNGVQVMATLRSLAMNALRLGGFWSITKGLEPLSHDIKGLLELLGWRETSLRLSLA
jgi:predicted transposase YbfD/YdcC